MRLMMALAVVLLIAACGGDEPSPQLSSESSRPTSAAPATTPEDDPAAPSVADAGFEAQVVFLQGNDLLILDGGSSEPRLIARHVLPSQVFISPNNEHILFASTDSELAGVAASAGRPAIYFLRADLDGNDHALLTQDQYWQILEWSPDSEWVIISFPGGLLSLFKIDGSERFENIFTGSSFRYWLEDGNLAVFDYETTGFGESQQFELRSAFILELETGQQTPIEVTLSEDSRNVIADIEDFLAEEGLVVVQSWMQHQQPYLAQTIESLENTDMFANSSGRLCDSWLLGTYDDIGWQTVYAAEDTYRIDSITTMEDGSVLFVQWQLANCGIGSPQGTLMQWTPAGNAEPLAEGVFGGLGLGNSSGPFIEDKHYYALSPDGEQLVWIGGSGEDWQTSLHLLDIEAGTSTNLYSAAVSQDVPGGNYPFISMVFWPDMQ